MVKKYYVVWRGREPGIFTDWNTCKKQVDKFGGAKYKSFKTLGEAEIAFHGKSVAAIKKSPKKNKSSSDSPAERQSSSQEVKTYTADEIAAMAIDTKIFTDGGCEPNPGKAGSGIAVYRNDVVDELWYGLYNSKGTNNTAELNALNQALVVAKDEIRKGKSVAIFCDSQYSIKCITQWGISWEKNGWIKKSGQIKNLELVKKTYALHQLLKDKVQVLHVNGHVGVEGNELADRMSTIAIESRDINFTLYREELDIPAILAMRTG
jgi:ribonuclease HI